MFVVKFASNARNVGKECRGFDVPRSSFYRWKRAFEKDRTEGLIRKKPVARSHPHQLAPEVVEKVLHLRRVYHLGPQKITWHLERYHGVKSHTVRTDRGHEWQGHFHWHVKDKGIRHVYIKPRSPQLNGKVGRSHRSHQEEFYQLLAYTDDVDLNKKLVEWENFYNYNRPHGAFNGKTPYEALRTMLK